MARTPTPVNQFPQIALQESVQVQPDPLTTPGNMIFTWQIASVADAITPWGRSVYLRDRQLRDFWPTEPYMAGSVVNVSFRNAAYDWEIRGPSDAVEQSVTDMLKSAIAGEEFGWTQFVKRLSQDLYTQDNGAFIELIRDPGMDANSAFKNERAPVVGIAHLDSNQCMRTGHTEYPVIYTDRLGKLHRMAWYNVIPFSDFPSAIQSMNGVGYCAVTRALRLGQIMRSIFLFKDEKVSGRHFKQMHIVSGVSRVDIDDAKKRGQADADNRGNIRWIEPVILASLDPEKPVSLATIDLANLPDGFDFDQEMKWYISGLALDFGVDYQEFAPLPGSGIGSANQSSILHRKSSGKGPAMFMKIAEAMRNYGVFPRGYEMIFEDRDEEKELEKQNLRKGFMEEMALAIRNGVVSPPAARKIGIMRGLYTERDFRDMPEDYGMDAILPGKGNVGQIGGNTMAEDAGRTETGGEKMTVGDRLRKAYQDYLALLRGEAKQENEFNLIKSIGEMLKKQNPPNIIVKAAEQQSVVIPAPIVNVYPQIDVKIPKPTGEVQTVERDEQGNIISTKTRIQYD